MAKLTTEEFIAKAKAVHGDRYDYSKVEYVGYRIPVTIICKEHGEFPQKPVLHLSGYGCSICSGRKKMRTVDFINRAKSVHGDKYDYSKTKYKGNSEEVCIICPEHGEFWQRAGNHLRGVGCKKCGIIKSSSKQKIWTREKCYETALQYKDIGLFCKECQVAYVIAHRNGWLKDYTWLDRKKQPNGYWTKELVMEEARKYTSAGYFKKNSKFAYNAAINHGWIKECTWFKKPKNAPRWNYDTCYEEALKYASTTEFRAASITAYCIARDKGWLDEYIWLEKHINPYNHDACWQEAKKYQYFNDFRAKSHPFYKAAQRQGWLDEYTWLIKEPLVPYNKKWNYDTCYAEAKKYKTRGAFNKYGGGAYDVARRNGWLADYTWIPDFSDSDAKVDSVYCYIFEEQKAAYVGRTLMYRQHIKIEKQTKWTEDVCREEALKYTSRKDFRKYCRGAYDKAKECGWLDSYTWLLYSKPLSEWNHESCKEEASKYSNKFEFQKHSYGAYKSSLKNGWLGEFYPVPLRRVFDYETSKQLASKYQTAKELAEHDRSLYEKIRKEGWLGDFYPQ